MPLAKRIIPCLDVQAGRVVKGTNFLGLKDAGDPVEIACRYNDEGADEIVLLDISASVEGRSTMLDVVKNISKNIFIPFSVGGGISSIDDMYNLLHSGCDKVSLNSAAVKNPLLIEEGARQFGSQCIIVAIDAKLCEPNKWHVFINGGRVDTGMDLSQWIKKVCDMGAGEILLTSMDADGTKNGYDIDMIESIADDLPIPLIASGGAGNMGDFLSVFKHKADAALAASVFHFREIPIPALKKYLCQHNISVRN